MVVGNGSQRLAVAVRGAVQGVGYRPFVFRLASELALRGWVVNNAQGVFIEVEGPQPDLDNFLSRIRAEKPPLALVQSIDVEWLPTTGLTEFEIRHSDGSGVKTALVLPDMATCPECLADILDPGNRRYHYPFTNCTNCGPRFTIIQALPYDRASTTMRTFTMCPECQAEYESPADRRFHAQPNACPVCGPQLAFYRLNSPDTAREGQTDLSQPHASATGEAAMRAAAMALEAGEILAVKGVGGFHLMVDARSSAAVSRLRKRKLRSTKPFAVMSRDLAQARQICSLSAEAESSLCSSEAPILLLPRRAQAAISPEVAPGNPCLGIMLPYTPLHHLLLREIGFPVVATSGNLSDEPICFDEAEAFVRLGGQDGEHAPIADAFLVHDRPIVRHVDDSVAWIVDGVPRLLRRARGYAPLPVMLEREAPTILATGAHQKDSVALSVGQRVFISQHIGDLETPEALTAFERVIADLLRLYEATPVALAHDLHPDYRSTRWAIEGSLSTVPSEVRRVAVQHHHAHLAACLADNRIEEAALGVIWDGTGYGPDGTIWGGEFLLGDASAFRRVANLRPFRLVGSEAAVRDPRRIAYALLHELGEPGLLDRSDLPPLRELRSAERRSFKQMLDQGFNSPITTSAGRLFDGFASLLGICQQVTYEGEAAMALEFAVDVSCSEAYPLDVLDGSPVGSLILDWRPTVRAAVTDLRRGVVQGIMAARFHGALVGAIVEVARRVGEPRVALSGGCFQNRFLIEGASRRLSEAGYTVLLHRQVPPNDGGISLGQVAIAAAQLASTQCP